MPARFGQHVDEIEMGAFVVRVVVEQPEQVTDRVVDLARPSAQVGLNLLSQGGPTLDQGVLDAAMKDFDTAYQELASQKA
ncbi:hypothetical protein [Actinoplanes subtropicus]|uniref:hypothetical protein n=1 Tax=Actinoplanes subtropicus TaxID=543632 RepID=UPI0004C45A84|nr:hypothetical protein [Actinoplanes subtropicus]